MEEENNVGWWRIDYSNLLHNSAEKWGVPVISGRPVITDHTDYQAGSFPIKEKLTYQHKKRNWRVSEISLFEFNNLWGYCLSLSYKDGGGMSYAAFMKFCDPYPSRDEALQAAAHRILHDDRAGKGLIRWASGLIAELSRPKQLSLFLSV